VCAISEAKENWRKPPALMMTRKNEPAAKEIVVAAIAPATPSASSAFAAIWIGAGAPTTKAISASSRV
jgi:hypothetical protein